MKRIEYAVGFAVVLVSMAAGTVFAAGTYGNTVEIKSDGSATLRYSFSESREEVELRMRQMEMIRLNGDNEEESAEPKKEEEPKPLTDAELEKGIRSMYERGFGREGGVESIKIGKDEVVTVMTNQFGSLEDLIAGNSMGGTAMRFQNTRVEKDTNSHLRLTFTPYKAYARNAASLKARFKATGKDEFKLTLPGKILSSGFPETQGNTTGYVLDSAKDDSFDKFQKLLTNTIVVVAELGGLSVDKPLESKLLWQKRRQSGQNEGDLPITDADPGFVAEAVGVTTTTIHYFPGGEAYMKKAASYDSSQQPGVTVSAKLFPPKDRTIESLSGVRLISATDDKNRAIAKFKMVRPRPEVTEDAEGGEDDEAPAATEEDDDEMGSTSYSGGDSERSKSIRFDIHLALPQADAESISELSCEAIAQTTTSWKELELTELKMNQTNEFDISKLVAGAKIKVTKYTAKKNNVSLEAQLEGPAADVRKLKIQIKFAGEEESSGTSFWEQDSKKSGANVIRKVTANGYHYSSEKDELPEAKVVLRFPEGQKRERVKFKLTGLDLF